MNRPDCWEILGINPTRNFDQIRDAFRKKAKLYHPDSYAQYTFLKDKYNFIDIKAAEDEAIQRAQSDSLSITCEELSENSVKQTFSTTKFNFLFKSFSNLSLGRLFQILSIFPAMLVCSLILEKIQNSLELVRALELIISIILGLIDGIFFGIFGGLLFFWLPGLTFILLLWAGIRQKTGYITFIFCWLACLAAYFIGFYQPLSSLETSEEIRHNIGNFFALVILPSFLFGGWFFLPQKPGRFEKSQASTP
ncbi:MAG: J domain-containing protein [SAR324 cluster bacterium]|nr:J domain-containing protein [SAR324 cluster bacterium]